MVFIPVAQPYISIFYSNNNNNDNKKKLQYLLDAYFCTKTMLYGLHGLYDISVISIFQMRLKKVAELVPAGSRHLACCFISRTYLCNETCHFQFCWGKKFPTQN